MELLLEKVLASPGSFITAIGVPTVLLWYIYYRVYNHHFYDLANKIPGPSGLPLVGNGLSFMADSSYGTLSMGCTKSVEKLWIGPHLIVFLCDPRDVELILESKTHIDKSANYQFLQPWLGNSMYLSGGDRWHIHRKLIAPAFHMNNLNSFVALFNAHSETIVTKLNEHVQQEIDCYNFISECALQILFETALGKKSSQGVNGFDYKNMFQKMCNIIHERQKKMWLSPDILFRFTEYGSQQNNLLDDIHSITQKVVKDRKDVYIKIKKRILEKSSIKNLMSEAEINDGKGSTDAEESANVKDDSELDEDDVLGNEKRSAFVDYLIERAQNGVIMTDDEIREQLDSYLFGGHETTAISCSFFLCIMAARPDIQENVFDELYNIFGDSDRPCTFQEALDMKYLERCIMETLRMYPPIPFIGRQIKRDLPLVSTDVTIPEQATVIINTFALHHQPGVYSKPDLFNPDNFLPENSAERNYYSFIPFSAGPRSCVGWKYALLKMKFILSTVLRNYSVSGGKKQNEWQLKTDMFLKRADGFNIKIEARKKTRN